MSEKVEALGRGTCKTCRWFDRIEVESDQGLCRESSPQVSIVMLPVKNILNERASVQPQLVANFPQVNDACWCGKYTAKWGQLAN